MRRISFGFLTLFIFFNCAHSQQLSWETYYEKSGYVATPSYAETIRYSRQLAENSKLISYIYFGVSPQGRSLPLLIADNSGLTDINQIKESNKAIILIQACIHAGESDGKDAGLMLLRDIAIKKQHLDLLDNVTILFVPIFNVDGHEDFNQYNRINQNGPEEMGWRATAQRLNLNRDYLKADASEMQSMIELYQNWMPDFYIDCHVTDGADYLYPLTYGIQMQGNLNPDQSAWLKNTYLPYVSLKMDQASQPIAPYMDFVQWHNPKSGIRSYYETPRYSGGYAAINNRPALLIETHMLKDYKTRVSSTYNMLLFSLELFSQKSKELIEMNQNADWQTSQLSGRMDYVLTLKPSREPEKFSYKGYEYDVEKSEISGGNYYKYSDVPIDIEIDQYFYEPDKIIELPKAYIIPIQWQEVIEKLKLHHVEFSELQRDTVLEVSTYLFENVKWNTRSFEGRIMLNYDVKPVEKMMKFPKGSKIVYLNQRAAQLAIHMLEPDAPDALLKWGFFNTIFEQKEYAESYVMEKMAREMLKKDPELKKRFEDKMANDEDFASNSWAILNWFYQQTPYWDETIGIYPVGRIMNK